MVSGSARAGLSAHDPLIYPGEGEVVHPGDAEHGVVDTVAFEAAVAEDFPGLHSGEDVLDASADLPVGPVVFLFPIREFGLATLTTVRDDESGAQVAAVGDREGLADSGLGAGLLPRFAVVAVAGERPADHDDQAAVGVDDDLMVGGVLAAQLPRTEARLGRSRPRGRLNAVTGSQGPTGQYPPQRVKPAEVVRSDFQDDMQIFRP